MSITVSTTEPRQLLDKITKYVKDGNNQTWEIDEDDDFTHSPERHKYPKNHKDKESASQEFTSPQSAKASEKPNQPLKDPKSDNPNT